MTQQIQLRRGTAARWLEVNPILAEGEIACEMDTLKFKIGNGVATWSALTYASGIQGPPGTDGVDGVDGVDGETSLNAAQTFTRGQRGAVVALTSVGSLVAIDLSSSNNFSHTTTQNTVLAAPSNPVAGQSGVIVITQGATIRTLAYDTFWKFASGVIPTLTATVGAVDVLAYFVESPTRATAQLIRNTK